MAPAAARKVDDTSMLDAHRATEVSTFRDMAATRRKAGATPGSSTMNPLSKLILARKSELDLTWQEIATRGGFSSHSIVHALARKAEHKQVPREITLRRLAKALDLPYDNVKQAAIDAAGFTVGEVQVGLADADTVRVIVASLTEMDDRDKEKLRRLAEAFAADARAARGE